MGKKNDEDWDIGKEAKELDTKSVKERVKLEKSVIIKMAIASVIFICVITILILVM